MIRYKLDNELNYMWSEDFSKEIRIPYGNRSDIIFVDILERLDRKNLTLPFPLYHDAYKLKLFFPNGEIVIGWTHLGRDYIKIHNEEELFNGMFNSTKIGE